MMLSQSAQSKILLDTWSSPEINRYEDLQDNIQTRKDDWYDTLDPPFYTIDHSGFNFLKIINLLISIFKL